MSRRLRAALSAVLLTVACLLVPFGALAAWVAYDVADTGNYVTAMAPLAGDPAVQNQIADTLGTGILRELGADPDDAALKPFVHDAVRSFTRTEAFGTAWNAANRAAHDAVLHSLRDGRHRPVTVDLAPVAAQVRSRLLTQGVPFARRIPVRRTEVALLPARQVDRLRKGYDVLEVAGFWLPVTAVALAGAGIALAAGRRRALTATALGTALGGALLGLAVALGRHLTLRDLPEDVSEPAAGAVYDALTATLRTTSWLLLALGVTVALTTWLTGRYRHRLPGRRPPAPG
ncbi:hypothetical protein ACL02U_19875 [Streptomyces sp. MS06]|uniref:hypothetical protein n=1 Tax=Streptomyces sp. MS06 TaxID=3385974 RepID=UPI0039A1098C